MYLSIRISQERLFILFMIVALLIRCSRHPLNVKREYISNLSTVELTKRIDTDLQLLLIIDQNLQRLQQQEFDYFNQFQSEKPMILTLDQRQEIIGIWVDYIDQVFVLMKLMLDYHEYSKTDGELRDEAYFIGYGSYSMLISSGLYFIQNTAFISPFEILLDEEMPEYGIPAGLYTAFKRQILRLDDYYNVKDDFDNFRQIEKKYETPTRLETIIRLNQIIEKRITTARNILDAEQHSLTFANYLDSIKDSSLDIVFPIQKGIALFMAYTRLTTRTDGFISDRQCRQFIQKAEPGDIILERGEWRMTNLGIPGFWPHSALYLGSPAELEAWSDDPEINNHYQKPDSTPTGFIGYLAHKYPKAFETYTHGENNEPFRVIEGLKEGIVFHTVSFSIGTADHVACLRPRLSKLDKAQAIEKAFQYWGRGYDYTFSLLSDNELVCSELIYKSYESATGKNGLEFQFSEIAGIVTLPANNIAAQFDQTYGTDGAQLDFVLFFDCNVRKGKAHSASVEQFRKSHLRPRWSFYLLDNYSGH